MASCYLCDELLTDQNCSVEHIFPNSIGGKLRSKDLLCRNCNSACGSYIDSELSEFIAAVASKYNINRDRGKTPDFIAKTGDTGEEMIVSSGLKMGHVHPQVFNNGTSITISAHNLKRVKQEMERWKEHFNKNGIQYTVTISKSIPRQQDIVYSRVNDPDVIIRAIAKIIINYFIYKTQNNTLCEPIISFLKGGIDNRFGWFFDLDICKNLHHGNPKHILIIKGDRKGKAIFAYVELFGEVGFVVLINGRYSGDDFQLNYTYDIPNCQEEEFNYDFPLKAGSIIDIIVQKPEAKMMKKLFIVDPVNSK